MGKDVRKRNRQVHSNHVSDNHSIVQNSLTETLKKKKQDQKQQFFKETRSDLLNLQKQKHNFKDGCIGPIKSIGRNSSARSLNDAVRQISQANYNQGSRNENKVTTKSECPNYFSAEEVEVESADFVMASNKDRVQKLATDNANSNDKIYSNNFFANKPIKKQESSSELYLLQDKSPKDSRALRRSRSGHFSCISSPSKKSKKSRMSKISRVSTAKRNKKHGSNLGLKLAPQMSQSAKKRSPHKK